MAWRLAPWTEYGGLVSGPVRVVVGDDDVLLREGMVRLLAEGGFDVVGEAGDAEEFVRKALAHRPDVAVVDMEVPPGGGGGGLQAALELRRRVPEMAVPVLAPSYGST